MFRWTPLGRRLAARQAVRKASGLAISDTFAWGRSGFTKLPCLRHHYTNKRVDRERTMEFRFRAMLLKAVPATRGTGNPIKWRFAT